MKFFMKLLKILSFLIALVVATPAMSQGIVTRQKNTPSKVTTKKTKTTKAKTPRSTKQTNPTPDDFTITEIKFANADVNGNILSDYGKPLYANTLCYVLPKYVYHGVSAKNRKTLFIRIINPSGNIERAGFSPTGYTFKMEMDFYPGNNWFTTASWGTNTPGYFKSGTYTWELWIDGKCVNSTNFYVN